MIVYQTWIFECKRKKPWLQCKDTSNLHWRVSQHNSWIVSHPWKNFFLQFVAVIFQFYMLAEDTQRLWEASCAEQWLEGREGKVCPSSTAEYPGTLCISLGHTEFLSVPIAAIRLWGKEGSNTIWSQRCLLYCFKQWYTCPVLFKCSCSAKIPASWLRAQPFHQSKIPPPPPEQNPSSWFSCWFQSCPKPWNQTVRFCHTPGQKQ